VEDVKKHWVPPALLAIALLGLSSIPRLSLPESEIPHLDKIVHATEYGLLAFLFARALFREGVSARRAALWAVFAVSLFGALDENYQRLTPGRQPDLDDFIADSLGACLGAVIWSRWHRKTSHGDHQGIRQKDPASG
jgi:VanZ family protein